MKTAFVTEVKDYFLHMNSFLTIKTREVVFLALQLILSLFLPGLQCGA